MGRASRTKRPLTTALPVWTPFQRGYIPELPDLEQRAAELAEGSGVPVEAAMAAIRETYNDVIWINSRYQVNIEYHQQPDGVHLVHLSIKRRDKEPIGKERFRDFQRIKNELVGPECEGVELYPAERRLVNTSNQYHVWVVDDPTYQFPFGYENRLVLDRTARMGGAKQEPLPDGYATPRKAS